MILTIIFALICPGFAQACSEISEDTPDNGWVSSGIIDPFIEVEQIPELLNLWTSDTMPFNMWIPTYMVRKSVTRVAIAMSDFQLMLNTLDGYNFDAPIKKADSQNYAIVEIDNIEIASGQAALMAIYSFSSNERISEICEVNEGNLSYLRKRGKFRYLPGNNLNWGRNALLARRSAESRRRRLSSRDAGSRNAFLSPEVVRASKPRLAVYCVHCDLFPTSSRLKSGQIRPDFNLNTV